MLTKLLKHEFRQTGKLMLPLFGVACILAGAMRMSAAVAKLLFSTPGLHTVFEILQSLLLMVTAIAMIAVVLTTLILAVLRFYKNLLGDEGYLMFTLPVTAGQLIASKLIVAVTWTLGGVALDLLLAFFISGNPLVSSSEGDMTLRAALQMLAQQEHLGKGIYWLPAAVLVLLIVGIVNSYLSLYLCMAIGAQWPQSRLLASIGAYAALNFGMQVLAVVGTVAAALVVDVPALERWMDAVLLQSPAQVFNLILCAAACLCAVLATVYFFVTRWLLTKKLNLA